MQPWAQDEVRLIDATSQRQARLDELNTDDLRGWCSMCINDFGKNEVCPHYTTMVSDNRQKFF
jgi:hypothetical protein